MPHTQKQKIGEIGENVACKFLVKHNFLIKDRNYRKKWGEIDIVAEKDKILHFIEVKAVSLWQGSGQAHEPEENVHLWKQKRLARAIRTYLLEKKISEETEWQIDIMAVFLDFKTRMAKIRITENVIL
jgi:putative endonuclease